MTALTIKERAKVNAALCIIHDKGLDAQAVANSAKALSATGVATAATYEKALNNFAAANPKLAEPLGHITRLIEASSPATVNQYDTALSQYIATGDNTGLVALAPTIEADSRALDAHNAELEAPAAAPEAGHVGESQVSAIDGPGYQSAGARANPVAYAGFAPDTSPFNGLTPTAAREAARAQASGRGHAVPTGEAAA